MDRTYPPGVPCWIDLEPPDADAAAHFYGELFGWSFEDAVPPGAPEHYLVASLDGEPVAAIGMPGSGAWNTYVAVDDVEAVIELASDAGGSVVDPPVDVGPAGRRATIADVDGAFLRLWRPGTRLGAQLVNGPGAWVFSILHTADADAADAFHGRLFGWEPDVIPGVDGAMWRLPGYGDHLAATVDPGIRERQAEAPPGFADVVAGRAPLDTGDAARWHVTFAVADRDASVAKALSLGATDRSGPVDTMWTRETVLVDPQGAAFTVSQYSSPDTSAADGAG